MKNDLTFMSEDNTSITKCNLLKVTLLSILFFLTRINLITNYVDKSTFITRKVLIEKV